MSTLAWVVVIPIGLLLFLFLMPPILIMLDWFARSSVEF